MWWLRWIWHAIITNLRLSRERIYVRNKRSRQLIKRKDSLKIVKSEILNYFVVRERLVWRLRIKVRENWIFIKTNKIIVGYYREAAKVFRRDIEQSKTKIRWKDDSCGRATEKESISLIA